MGVRFPSVQSNTFVGPLPASAVETVVVTSPPFTPPLDSAVILILWHFVLTAGASVTSHTFKLRRGATTAGVQVNQLISQTTPAGGFNIVSGWYFDQPTAVTGQQYSLTIIQTGATGAGIAADQAILVFAL